MRSFLKALISLTALCGFVFFSAPVHAELPTVSATFSTNPNPFTLEVAATQSDRMVGLMYRNELSPESGMIFVYPNEAKRTFWMKNTLVSLDMVFLDKKLRVQGVVKNTPPHSTAKFSLDDDSPSMYVVELVAGTAERIGIARGSTLTVSGELPKAEDGP